MAIDWGAWEGASPNRLRIGIEVSWETITHSETVATATVEIHLDAEGSWSDTQTITFGGSISGSVTFSNNQSNNSVLRATKTYDYTYGSNSYGSSPASKTFTASLSGAFNGATPSNSVTSNVPARPYAAPAAPTNVAFSRVSDTSTKITWTNNDTAGEPWDTLTLQKSTNGGAWVTISSSISGSATSYTHGTSADNKYDFQIRANNSIGSSGYASSSSFIYTTPDVPTSPLRSGANGANQVLTWNNNVAYTEYQTEVWRSTNGVWALLTTIASGTATYTDTYPATHPSDKFKYKFRSKTTSGVQGTLYSAYTAETTETTGTTYPHLAPSGLSPNNITVDPTLNQNLTWNANADPAAGSDPQQKFFLRHRLQGASSWTTTTEQTTSNTFWSLPANTYADAQIVEWQVQTRGADPTYSPWSESAIFNTAVTAIAPDPVKIPLQLDLFTGKLEASTTAYELRNYLMRAQSQLMGGGVRAVSATYGLTWSQRFITLGIGRSPSTFRAGHHDIVNPFGWNNSLKEIVSNVAKLTFTASTNRARVGDTITVTGVGAPFDGQWVVRESGSNYVKWDLVNANIASTAATGATFCTIKGHGGVADSYPNGGIVTLGNWEALWYDMPFGWGSGTTPRKNGLVTVTFKSLTANVAKLEFAAPHYFAIGDRIAVSGVDATFDTAEVTVTGTGLDFITYAKTASNVTRVASGGLIAPNGKDTFFGNFHKTTYTADFVVPDNWILLAMRNGDAATVEWGTGDAVDPGFDSDSPVLKQVILNSTSDVTATAGNKPALRIGSVPNGVHVRMDGNEIQAMTDDNSVGAWQINLGGGGITLGGNGLSQVVTLRDFVEIPNAGTTTAAANCNLNGSNGNRVRVVTSLSKFKLKQKKITLAAARGLLKVTPKTWFDRAEVEENEGSTEGLRRVVGLVAEDVEENAPEWALYLGDELNSVAYDRVAAGLLVLVQDLYKQNEELAERVRVLEERGVE